jgi:transcriptional regulator with PAS, ATPase and Fis domain
MLHPLNGRSAMYDPIKSHEITSLIFDNLSKTGVTVVTDSEDRIIAISDHYVKILNREKKDIIGHPVSKIIPNTIMPAIRKKGQPDCKLFTLANGETVVAHYVPLIQDNKTLGVFAYTSMNTIDYMSTLSTMDKVRRLNDELNQFKNELQKLRGAKYSLNSIIGSSAEIVETKELAKKVAQTKSTVMITGETGTGKELFAHAIHQLSPRRHQSFIALNCAAIPKDLIESELFGYEEGAFSGARKGGKPGKFEMAHRGTLYLDEIDQLPLPLQSKILRTIQEKEIERIGGTKITDTDIRLICTSNRNLRELVEKSEFREDLYYRIHVVSLNVPSLRERLDDIPVLVNHFIAKINNSLGLNIQGVHMDVLKSFKRYNWPGNVRELEHMLERAANIALSGQLNLYHFEKFVPRLLGGTYKKAFEKSISLSNLKVKTERDAIISVLRMTKGNKKRASEILQIDRSVLYKKICRYKIDVIGKKATA